MSQFTYVNDLKSAVRMDEPITSGPAPRWMKKSVESTSRYVYFYLLHVCTLQEMYSIYFCFYLVYSDSSVNTSRKTIDLMPIKKTPSKTPNKSKSPG